MEIHLTHLANLLERCWIRAEQQTARLVSQKYPAPCEENLTFLFSGELREVIEQASEAREVDSAFLSDLRASVPNLPYGTEQHVHGLIARVTFHGRWHEGRHSGADLGLVVSRPLVELSWNRLEFRRGHATGLLAQAKLGCSARPGNAHLKWGRLTAAQVKKFPVHRNYYSLLLYRLRDATRAELQSFGWQLCKDHSLAEVKRWLTSDTFPCELTSTGILHALFGREIGTEDPEILRSLIDPSSSHVHAIELRVTWPDHGGPPPSLYIQQTQETIHLIQQHLKA